MRAAAEFGREAVRQLDHAHLVAILLAEERHRVVLVDGHVDGHVVKGFDCRVGQDFAVDDVLDLFEFLVGDLGEVGEVETQAIGMHGGAGLLDVRAEDLSQGRVQQVRAGVIAADGVAAVAVDDSVDVVADGESCFRMALWARTPWTGERSR